MNQVSVVIQIERIEREFDSLRFLVHESVRDLDIYQPPPVSCHFSWTKFVLFFCPVWDCKIINIDLFCHKPLVVLTQVVHKSS